MIPSTREIRIVGGYETLTLFLDSPSEKEAIQFADHVIGRSKEVLQNKYGNIDPDLSEEVMFNQLNLLRIRNIISDTRFQELKSEYRMRKLLNP